MDSFADGQPRTDVNDAASTKLVCLDGPNSNADTECYNKAGEQVLKCLAGNGCKGVGPLKDNILDWENTDCTGIATGNARDVAGEYTCTSHSGNFTYSVPFYSDGAAETSEGIPAWAWPLIVIAVFFLVFVTVKLFRQYQRKKH